MKILTKWYTKYKSWRPQSKLFFWIAVASLFIAIIPLLLNLNNLLKPAQQLTIYHISAQYYNKSELLKLLDYPYHKEINLIQGCNEVLLTIGYNFRGDTPKRFPWCVTDKNLLDCHSCVSYAACLVNEGKEVIKDFKLDITMFDSDYKIIDQTYPIKIEPLGGLVGRVGFRVVIDKILGNSKEVARVYFGTTDYNEVYYNCDMISKQKCKLIRYDIAIPRNFNETWLVIKKLNAELPPMSYNIYEHFQYFEDQKKFVKHGPIPFTGQNNNCSFRNPSINPKTLITI